jgi:signal transduction histidine kinase
LEDASRQTDIRQLIVDDLPSVRYYLEIHEEVSDILRNVARYVGGDAQAQVVYMTDYEQLTHYVERLKAVQHEADERQAIVQVTTLLNQVDERARMIFDSYKPEEKSKAVKLVDDIEHNELAQLQSVLSRTVDERREYALMASEQLQERVWNVSVWSVIILVLGIIASVLLSLWLARKLYRKLGADPDDLVQLTTISDYGQLKPVEVKAQSGLDKEIRGMINRLHANLQSVLYNSRISTALSVLAREFVGQKQWDACMEVLALKLQETFKLSKVVVLLQENQESDRFKLHYLFPSRKSESLDLGSANSEEVLVRLRNKRELNHQNLHEYAFKVPENCQVTLLPLSYEGELAGMMYLERTGNSEEWMTVETEAFGIIAEMVGQALGRIRSNAAIQVSSENYRSIFNNSYNAILLCEKNGNIIEANSAFKKMYNDPLSPPLGSIYSFMETSNRTLFKQWFEGVLQRKKDENLELYFENLRHGQRAIQMSGHLIQYSGEEVILLFFNDITDHKLREKEAKEFSKTLETRIKERTRQLEASNAELESFSYSVSHDLRAPLRAIVGFSSILQEDYQAGMDEDAKQYLGNIQRNAVRMGKLIDEILAFSRLHRSAINRQRLDLGKLFEEELEGYKETHKLSKLEYVIDKLPPAEGAPELIRQVVHNLISNAIKYSSREVKPLIEVGVMNENGENVYFVRDNGVGFNNKYKAKLFGVFQRLHNEKEFEGTGVGLAFVRRIIIKHGGRIWGDGEVNKGATFYFTIPDKSE